MPLRGYCCWARAMLQITSVVLAESGGPTTSWIRASRQPPSRSAQSRVRLPVLITLGGAGLPLLGAIWPP
jgi:hypothetical protein